MLRVVALPCPCDPACAPARTHRTSAAGVRFPCPMPYFLFFRKNVGLPADRISALGGEHGRCRPARPHAGGARDGNVAMEDEEPVDSVCLRAIRSSLARPPIHARRSLARPPGPSLRDLAPNHAPSCRLPCVSGSLTPRLPMPLRPCVPRFHRDHALAAAIDSTRPSSQSQQTLTNPSSPSPPPYTEA